MLSGEVNDELKDVKWWENYEPLWKYVKGCNCKRCFKHEQKEKQKEKRDDRTR